MLKDPSSFLLTSPTTSNTCFCSESNRTHPTTFTKFDTKCACWFPQLKCTGEVFSEDRNPGRSCGNRQTKLTNQGSGKRVGHVANIFLFHDASVVWTACSGHICEGMLLNCRPSVWVLLCLLAVGPPCNFSNPRPCSVKEQHWLYLVLTLLRILREKQANTTTSNRGS